MGNRSLLYLFVSSLPLLPILILGSRHNDFALMLIM